MFPIPAYNVETEVPLKVSCEMSDSDVSITICTVEMSNTPTVSACSAKVCNKSTVPVTVDALNAVEA